MTETPSKPRQKTKAAIAREEILAVAARKMRQNGYADMSLRLLATEVGMKAGSLYYHFPSKDALASEVMRLGVEVVQNAVRAALAEQADATARQRLITAMRVHLETLLSASDYSSAHIRCYPFVPEAVRAELTEVRKSYDRDWDEVITAYLGDAADKAQIRHLRHTLLGALNWSLEWFDPERDSAEGYIASLSQLLPQQAP
ncbi:MAG: TetR/AcrR family transcriptional regulator [Pseudomonadota bacterium]|nr:TetR/AcrR family transcriptional regulator [Pseudomonadota bacterium]MEC8042414.1 TetR/AcrR family transcriptional regulator [Pseudomonadota bacterium]MEC8293440.1 TetR/AcrR family transcriptional regulator [Pseudomonadota bacterium]